MTEKQKKILKVYYEKTLGTFLTSLCSFSNNDLIYCDADYQILRETLDVPSFKDWVKSNYKLEILSGIRNFYDVIKHTLLRIYIEDNDIDVMPSDDTLRQSVLLKSLPEEDRLFTHLPPMSSEELEDFKYSYREFYDYFTNKETRERYKQYMIDELVEDAKKYNIQ